MKKITLVLILLGSSAAWCMAADNGQAIFTSNGCTACHKPAGDSKITPSLAEIAAAYKGNRPRLVDYLKGAADPIIRPEKAGMMTRKLVPLQQLSDDERKALADFLLAH